MRALSPYEAAACNYMQRPKNAAALSRDATKREGREAFMKLRNSDPGLISPPFPFSFSPEVRDGSAVVFH